MISASLCRFAIADFPNNRRAIFPLPAQEIHSMFRIARLFPHPFLSVHPHCAQMPANPGILRACSSAWRRVGIGIADRVV
jgi:hypothetical protein